jgi:hypothetical protein
MNYPKKNVADVTLVNVAYTFVLNSTPSPGIFTYTGLSVAEAGVSKTILDVPLEPPSSNVTLPALEPALM